MDTMTYLIHRETKLPRNRIIGMGGALDSARFKYFLSMALGANPNEIEGIVIGGHGDTTMIPLKRYAAYRGIPASSLMPAEQLDKVAADTMVGGARPSSKANMAKKTSASAFPVFSVATVSKRLLNSTSTKKKRHSSPLRLLQYTKPTLRLTKPAASYKR